MAFTHLQVRSGYSLLESTNTIENLVQKAADDNFKALALTDDAVLYGVIPFYKACLKHGIKPVIGMTIHVQINNIDVPCILLAKNNDGYTKLMQLSTEIHTKEVILDFEKLSLLTDNLICILPVYTCELRDLLTDRSHEQAELYVSNWTKLFKPGDFYLGIQADGLVDERQLHLSIKAFHDTQDIPVVAINDVRYMNAQDDLAYDCLQAMKSGEVWQPGAMDPVVKERYLKSETEMQAMFVDFWPEVLEETESIQQKCNVSFDFDTRLIPSFPVPQAVDAHTYLSEICWNNVKEKYREVTKEVSDRLAYELNIIESMAFSDYFLIVWDFIAYAKNNHILVGPGRGSAAGSIVAYVLGITDVDPIKFDLLFERFLNPERVTMPDIDIDFSDNRRDEVIAYVREKYGEDHVAQIITFGRFGARSLLRELFKVMEINERDAAFILSKIPSQANKSLITYVEASVDLKEYIKQSKELRLLFSVALKLEGLPRHTSTHAAGVIISEQPLTAHTPLIKGSNDTNITQYAMHELEAIGLLKMDFLGLRNLTLLDQITQSIVFSTNQNLDLNHIPEDDNKTYALLRAGQTNGIFQLESPGMKQVLTKLKPTTFEDIVAVNALFRPGPMDYIPVYIDRKHGIEKVIYPHPDLEPIIAKTYGVLVYQEQIMQVAHKIAGYSLGEADVLRRAVSKKESALMAEQKTGFINGCLHNGYEQKVAEEIFEWIVKFSSYGFNRSHAVAYSKISYELAYLKAHYPAHFFAELLSSIANQYDKISQYINEVKELGLTVAPPSINKSIGKYSVEKDIIRMGLLSIKGIGYQTVKDIMAVRKAGPFKNLFDFCLRIPLKVINRKTLELLITAGTFDEIYPNRASLIGSIDQAINQGELFGGLIDQPSFLPNEIGLKEVYAEIPDFSQMKKLSDEKELLGHYVSSHPLKEYRKQLNVNGYTSLKSAEQLVGKRKIKTAVIVQTIKEIRTKRGDPMAFITISDEASEMEAVVFPELYRNEKKWLEEEAMIFMEGNIEERNGRKQWLLAGIKPFDSSALTVRAERLFIKLVGIESDVSLQAIRRIANAHQGSVPIIIYQEERKKTYQLASSYSIDASSTCLSALIDYFGEGNVVLEKQ